MKRKEFVLGLSGSLIPASLMSSLGSCTGNRKNKTSLKSSESGNNKRYPLAITMWDFSWLERRWPGAGYEDWDKVLDELVFRGYDAVRIDAYPHLIAADPEKEWLLDPHWDNMLWGSPAINKVQVQPNLNIFISKCKERNVRVALSTWWREDRDRLANKIKTTKDLADVWIKTLDSIDKDGLLDQIEFVDLSNEFPIDVWTPFLENEIKRQSETGQKWMRESIEFVREKYPDLDYTFSFTSEYEDCLNEDVSFLDVLELHCWIVHWTDFYKKIGYEYTPWGNESYNNLVQNGEKEYYKNRDKYRQSLSDGINLLATWSIESGKPVGTTECWGPVDYKDWPLLDWAWVKDICDFGTREAAKTGRWKWIATSNFCGPQFVGMWRDVSWHQKLTRIIKESRIDKDLL